MLAHLPIKKLFLMDALGATVTTLLLSQVVARFEGAFGMPHTIVYVLAGAAGCFALYSFLCYSFLKDRGKPYLLGIAIANSLYALVTLTLVIFLYPNLTWLGVAYFLGEIAIIVALVTLELRFIKRSSN